ncbi:MULTISPECIES: aspartate kinase [Megasphaera]|uniref:Aspartokinase n=1 Tax=Megasphaera stantonii TaxID=2144175 RepID=A0A346B2B7_9FIRM|nr:MULTISPECIES: aspartate kinase [Megasphaera]SCJ47573.1 Aspartokinase [uncultured Ruminococcus sp.]AXL22260.1 aspartate kinase [Megasphaera stantonii]MCU6715009.1 aspartate kinase [Megasphaera butyrica]SCH88085.1 Aspartokinase [uncultured Megasphaera sp.]HJE83740.1 aspartate kinase [Megasphaera stantonii]
MALIVKKFGGSSVATPDKMRAIVQRVLKGKQEGDKIVIVVSAMGDTTDELVSLAKQITSKAYGREMDMLLSTGEQVSIALMAMAFQEAGQKAISFTGAQAGIKTSDAFNKGRILDLEPNRIMEALDEGNVVVVAGFQGITGHGDITTLGRGGSDTTAVAIAGAINADVCEIYTDVDGVYTSDPRVVPNAQKMKEITYGEMLEMAKLGAGVMQPRAVEMGSRFSVPIHVRSTFSEDEGTMIQEVCSMEIKQYLIRGVASDKNVAKITVLGIPNQPGHAYKIFSMLADSHVDVDMIVQSVRVAKEGVTDITFTIARTELPAAKDILNRLREEMPVEDILVDDKMAKVSIVGAGMAGHPGIAAGMFGVLGDNHINIEIISTSEISITCLIGEESVDTAVKAIHAHFFDEH